MACKGCFAIGLIPPCQYVGGKPFSSCHSRKRERVIPIGLALVTLFSTMTASPRAGSCRCAATIGRQNSATSTGDLLCPLYVDSGRRVVDLLRRHPRHNHTRHFRIEPANSVAASPEIRRIGHGRPAP